MKLALDHHYPTAIADGLRSRGHHVVTLLEPGWHQLDDAEVLERCSAEGLTLVGQHEMAVKQIDAALSGVTADTDMLRLAATVMARSGEFERSVSLMKSALQLDPAMSPARWMAVRRSPWSRMCWAEP